FVASQGGDATLVDHPERMPHAPVTVDVTAAARGYVAQVAPREIGLAVVALGGGRRKKDDPIDHRVGVIVHAKVGDVVPAGAPLATIHAASEKDAQAVYDAVQAAFQVVDQPVAPLPILLGRVTSADTKQATRQ